MATFKTTIFQDGNNTAIEIPAEVVESFNAGKRVPVKATINGYSYRSTAVVYGGRYLIPLAKEHRDAAGVQGGQTVEVTLVHDTEPRVIEIPEDFKQALTAAGALAAFEALAYSHRKEHVRAIEEAKAPETRARRIEKAVEMVNVKA
jgi:hypothetical protein